MSVYDISGDEISPIYNLSGSTLQNAYNVVGETIYPVGRSVIFEDDFNFFDDTKWAREVGLVRNTNSEAQCYRAENVSIENSCLVLTAKRESYGGKQWTSGSINGQLLQYLKYGRYEAKIKFPNVVGAFAAFWMVGSNAWKEYVDGGLAVAKGVSWPECGEVDITETIPGDSTKARATLWSYTGTSLGTGQSGNMVSSDWHIYALEWTSEYMAAYLDDVEFKRWTFSNYRESEIQAYRLPMHMILNLAVGAAGGTPEASTNEMKMYVDWVRVYAPLDN